MSLRTEIFHVYFIGRIQIKILTTQLFFFLELLVSKINNVNLKCVIGGESLFLSNWRFKYQLFLREISNMKENKMQCRKNLKKENVLCKLIYYILWCYCNL